ncbi:MAG: hypothetical protein EBQ79_02375 [Actinobacteria bacterium]|nr:hypothetical protein [Actinomycetota bacterium]
MRFVIATVLLISSMVTFVVGLAIKGPFEAAAESRLTYKIESPDSYVLIPHETLTKFEGDVSVEASGIKNIFYADAREQDIQYWIGTSNFLRLGVNPANQKPVALPIRAGGTNASPVDSDLWRNQLVVKTSLLTKVAMFEDTGVLLAGDGFNRGPQNINIIWKTDQPINWPLVLFGLGAAFLMASLIVNYLGFRNIRKLRGPRRRIPKAPTGPKYRRRIRADVPKRGRRATGRTRSKLAILPVGILTVSLLNGCANTQAVENAEVTTQFEKVGVVVTDSQLQRIVGDLATKVKAADTDKDWKALAIRAAGPVLEIRKVRYLLQSKSKKIKALPDIVANPVTVSLPMQLPEEETAWQPRTIMLVTKSEETTQGPQLMVLQQHSPRENYKLWYLIDLLPGNTFPEVAAQDAGALTVESDNAFLATKLDTLPYKYGNVLNKGTSSTFAREFDLKADKFFEARNADQNAQKEDLKKVKATISFQHALGDKNISGMLTLKSGGLIAVAMTDTSIIKPTVRGSAVSVTQAEQKILLNAPGSATGLSIKYENMLCSMSLLQVQTRESNFLVPRRES